MDIKKGLTLNETQKKLVEEHHNLIYSFLRKYHFDQDEWYDLAAIGLCKAAYYFKESEGYKFSTFAYKVMKVMLSNEIKCKSSSTHIPNDCLISYDATMQESGDSFLELFPGNADIETEAITKVDCDAYIKKQKGRKLDFLKLYQKGYSSAEIAKQFQCTTSFVTETRKRCKNEFLQEYA